MGAHCSMSWTWERDVHCLCKMMQLSLSCMYVRVSFFFFIPTIYTCIYTTLGGAKGQRFMLRFNWSHKTVSFGDIILVEMSGLSGKMARIPGSLVGRLVSRPCDSKESQELATVKAGDYLWFVFLLRIVCCDCHKAFLFCNWAGNCKEKIRGQCPLSELCFCSPNVPMATSRMKTGYSPTCMGDTTGSSRELWAG